MPSIHRSITRQTQAKVAGFLNQPGARVHRSSEYKELRLHVSDLIKSDPAFKFCEREMVIKHLLKPTVAVGKLPASFELLFSIGHALHDHVRNRWIAEHGEGFRALGRWRCPCRRTTHHGILNPRSAIVCETCKCPVDIYDEWEVFDDPLSIVAHPDFIMVLGKKLLRDFTFRKERDVIQVMEIKGIDRKSVDFSTLDGPLGDHRLQGSMYWWLLHRAGYRLHDKIAFLYADRRLEKLFTELPYKEFYSNPSPYRRVERFFDKAKLIKDSIANRTVPERTLCSSSDCARAKNCSVPVYCFGLPKHASTLASVARPKRGIDGHL